MSAIPHPLRNPQDWGRVLIGGSVLPGTLTDIVAPSRNFNWNKNRGFGLSMVTTFQSVDILDGISFTHFLELKTTGADDWDALQAFLKTLLSKWPIDVQERPKSYAVVHPAMQYLGAKRVHLVSFSAPTPPPNEKIPQFYTVTFQEDVPDRKPQTGTAEKAVINGPPTPQTQIEAGLMGMWSQISGTPPAQLQPVANATVTGSAT